ncbi:MAG: ferrochelatase [Lysobacterales bacterium]
MSSSDTRAYPHGSDPLTAVLLVNLGTPTAPTPAAVRRYLAEFLSDPRVIELPRWLWLPILHGVILRTRPARSARAYQKIWGVGGSPLLTGSQALAERLQQRLANAPGRVEVHLAMRYGEPSIAHVLSALEARHLRRLLVLPLYPQYSASTTASVFDAVSAELQRWRFLPEVHFVRDYYAEPAYARALASSVRQHWQEHGRDGHLLFSFHGIPERYFKAGDPYYCHCQASARRVAEMLQLEPDRYSVSFQSRVGRERWLHPYTDQELLRLAGAGVGHVDVICPAFAVDCLETLEEIAIGERERFLAHGGRELRYIPALNAGSQHVDLLDDLVRGHSTHWPEWSDTAMTALRNELARLAPRHRAAVANYPGGTMG